MKNMGVMGFLVWHIAGSIGISCGIGLDCGIDIGATMQNVSLPV